MANKKVKKTTKKTSKSTKAKKTTKEAKQLVTKQILIGELAAKYPKAISLLFEAGMHCLGCGMTAYETLEQGCQAHGISDEDIDKLVEKINKAVSKQ